MYEWTNVWMVELDEYSHRWQDGCIDGCIDGWMDRVDEHINGWTDGGTI